MAKKAKVQVEMEAQIKEVESQIESIRAEAVSKGKEADRLFMSADLQEDILKGMKAAMKRATTPDKPNDKPDA